MGPQLLVVSALAGEQAALRRRHRGPLPRATERLSFLVTGDGAEQARGRLRQALSKFGPSAASGVRVVVVGLAGGLSSDAPPLSVWTGISVRRPGEAARALSPWPALRPAHLISAPQVVPTAAQKRDLREQEQAPTPTLVDLETAAYLDACEAAGVSLSVLRVVSDGPEEDLPDSVAGSVRPDGGISVPRVVARAALRPSDWAGLRRLQRRFTQGTLLLADAFHNHARSTPVL